MAKIYNPATKSLNPWNVDDDIGWNIIGQEGKADDRELVPVVSACIDEIAKSMADLPFSIYNQRGAVVDDSDDYKNITGAIPDPYSFLWLTTSSLVMSGQAYWGKKYNPAGYTKGLAYWSFANVSPVITPTTTEENLTFRRANVNREIPAGEVLYVWLPDPKVEFGPAMNYPLRRALKSAGSLSAISAFVDNYMNSGMVKAFIAQSDVPPSSEDERRDMQDYLTRILTGVRKTLSQVRVIKKSITIQSIGGGIDELKNVGIVKEIKNDVLESFGVPASRLWGDAANYATAANDTMVFITSEIMPLARVIQGALNKQIFAKYGYKFAFEPRRMEEFAIVVGQKVESLENIAKSFERALGPAEALKASIDLLGLDLAPELIQRIELSIAQEKAPKPEPAPIQPQPEAQPQPQPQPEPINTKALVELDRWRAKSEKAGKTVTWHNIDLPDWAMDAIKSGESWQDVRDTLKAGDEIKSYSPPGAVRDAARRGLELRQKYGRGGLTTQEAGAEGIGSGVARASNLANGDNVSIDTIRRMVAFFNRHEKNKSGGEDDAGYIAWQLWGGDAGRAWAERILRQETGAEKAEIIALADAINQATESATKAAPIQSQPIINVTMPAITLTAQMPEQSAPAVTVNVPEQPANVTINVPEQSAPIVNVNVPEQPAPVVNVTAQPANVTLSLPKPAPVEIVRDVNTGLAKEIRPKK